MAIILCQICAFTIFKAAAFTSGSFTYTALNATDVKMTPTNRNTITSAIVTGSIYYGGVTYNVTSFDFSNCPNLRRVEVWSSSVTSIPRDALSNCTSLTSVTLEEGVQEIGQEAFSGCTALRSITLPEGITKIGHRAFYGCSSLSSLSLPASTKLIESNIIEATGVKSVYVPAGVSTLYVNAFVNSNLESIEVDPSHPFLSSDNGVLFSKCNGVLSSKVMLHYPQAKKDSEFTITCDIVNPDYGLYKNKNLRRLNLSGSTGWPYLKQAGLVSMVSQGWLYDEYDVSDISIKGEGLEYVNIGNISNIANISKAALPNLKSVEVGAENRRFVAENGLIYCKGKNYASDKFDVSLWLVTPGASDLTAFTGSIENDHAFDWCNNLKEIFDFSPRLGYWKSFGGLSLVHINHSVSYYACPSQTDYMYDNLRFNYNSWEDNQYKPNVYILADIQSCWRDMDDYWDENGELYVTCNAIYGPKGGKIQSFLYNPSLYGGDLNIITVNASDEIRRGVTINNHRTHVFGVKDNTPVSVTFSELPDEYKILLNGTQVNHIMQGNTLYLSATSHAVITVTEVKKLTVVANEAVSTIYIDDVRNNTVIADGEPHNVHVVPHEGYYICSATLNDEDVTDKFINRIFTVPASNDNQTLNIDLQPVNEAKLTVQNPEFRVAHYFNQGARVMVDLTPHTGWNINSATFNDEDVTDRINSDNHIQTPPLSGNDVLAVTYAKDEPTNLENPQQSSAIHVYTRANSIIIKGKDADLKATLYNESGLQLRQTTDSVIDNLSRGVYILTIGENLVFKLGI